MNFMLSSLNKIMLFLKNKDISKWPITFECKCMSEKVEITTNEADYFVGSSKLPLRSELFWHLNPQLCHLTGLNRVETKRVKTRRTVGAGRSFQTGSSLAPRRWSPRGGWRRTWRPSSCPQCYGALTGTREEITWSSYYLLLLADKKRTDRSVFWLGSLTPA